MQITGTVVSIENNVEIQKQAGGVYQGSRLAYRDHMGAMKEQCFHNNSLKFNPNIKLALGNLNQGQTFTMVKEKEGEFWNVKSITTGGIQPTDSSSPETHAQTKAYTSPKSTYETPEERALRQVMIVRQSSISSAIAYLNANKKNYTVMELVNVAKQFENHVFDKGVEDDGSIDSLESDEID